MDDLDISRLRRLFQSVSRSQVGAVSVEIEGVIAEAIDGLRRYELMATMPSSERTSIVAQVWSASTGLWIIDGHR